MYWPLLLHLSEAPLRQGFGLYLLKGGANEEAV